TGADTHAVVSHAVEIDQILLTQYSDGVRQQPVEELDVSDAEIGEGVVIDADAAGQPAEGVVVLAQPDQGTGRADTFEGGVKPQGDAQAWVDGRVAWAAKAGADMVVEG